MSTDARTKVMLGRYEGVVLNGVGMRMKMMGPGDIIRLRETCEGIVTENNTDSGAGGDLIGQIQETFLNNEISDVCVMCPDVLDHYAVMESDRLEPLRTIFEGMNSKDTVIMIRLGINLQFYATKFNTMVQVREMSVAGVISGGCAPFNWIPLTGKLLSWNHETNWG